MKKYTSNSQLVSLVIPLICTGLLVWQTGCSSRKTAAVAQAPAVVSASGMPALFVRTGELAKAIEWPRTQAKVTELKMRIDKAPNDLKARLQLVAIYLSEARITGEHPYYYPAILTMLDGVLAIDPANFEATTYKASVKMSQHQFAEARTIAERARAINPANAYVYGVLVDANVELGDYEQAVAMSDKMQALKPSLESYARASYLREIYGSYPGAIIAMKLAVEAGLPGSEPYCWSKNILGQLYETTGKLDEADREYAGILVVRPSYAMAMAGQARVLKARRQYDQALTLLNHAAAIMPEFSFHEQMAMIYAQQGKTDKATAKYADVARMLGEDARSGHVVDLELCKLYTLSGQPDSALVYGLREYAKRPRNIDVNHALAQVYANRHELDKARQHLKLALRTGSKNPELRQLAGVIELAPAQKVARQ